MNRVSSAASAKKTYLQFMNEEIIKVKKAKSLPFIRGFTRHYPIKQIEIVQTEDDLTNVFNMLQSQLDRLTMVSLN